jgi:hypothetical protein
MPENKRKNRLFAFSSIVCRQAGPPDHILRTLLLLSLNALERLENHEVSSAFPPAQRQQKKRGMDAVNEFMT